MNDQIKLLDQGYIRFIEAWGHGDAGIAGCQHQTHGDEDNECGIVEAARMSTQASFRGWEQDQKLLNTLYLSEPQHATPFEFAGATIEVKAPIAVFREWHRHRSQCLSGDTPLIFESPTSGKSCPMLLSEVVRKWNAPPAKRQRAARSICEYNRKRIGSMRLRGAGEKVNITDAWYSGKKKTYRVVTKYGQVEASADHLFKTPDGPARITDGLDYVLAVIQTGGKHKNQWPDFTAKELAKEEWRQFTVGYEISTLGRVRSYRTTRGFKTEPRQLKLVENNTGRVVVNIKGKAVQVSHMVARSFLGWEEGTDVLHNNDNPLDNRVRNLKLGDDYHNAQDRIRNGNQTRLQQTAVKVLRIEKCGVQDTFDISVTGHHWFCADNLIVHNSYNEMSARYAPLPCEDYVPDWDVLKERGERAEKTRNKQEAGTHPWSSERAANWLGYVLPESYKQAEAAYQYALEAGVPKELARLSLTVGRYSKMRASANLRNWLAFVTLRFDPAAQWEIREYAKAVASILAEEFPRTWTLYVEKKSPAFRIAKFTDDELRAEMRRRGIGFNPCTEEVS